MQLKKRTSKPVPPPAKICSFLTGRGGYGLTAILLAMLAAAMLVIPLTRWYLGISAGTDDLQTKLMVQTIAKDKWDEIHAETFDDLAAALAANPSPWTEYVGDGNRWKIETTIGEEGKYVNAACADGAAGATDRKCRKVSIQVTDTMTGMTQAVNLAKVDSEFFNSRMKAMEDSISSLNTTVSSHSASLSSMGTRMTAAENKFGNYYTAAQVNSKLGSYYTKSETDKKLKDEAASSTIFQGNSYEHHACGNNNFVHLATGRKCTQRQVWSQWYQKYITAWTPPGGVENNFGCNGEIEYVMVNSETAGDNIECSGGGG